MSVKYLFYFLKISDIIIYTLGNTIYEVFIKEINTFIKSDSLYEMKMYAYYNDCF